MENIRLLGITLLVMTSQAMTSTQALAAEGDPVAPLTVAPRPVTDWLTLDGTVTAIHQGTVGPRPAAGSPVCWWM